jgi:hypothetical protein
MPSFFRCLSALVSVATLAVVPVACQSGGVGDPCTPEDEYDARFGGFNVAEGYIESRSFQCATRVCLVNHFQGRVSCPLGQSARDIHPCRGRMDTTCGGGQECVPSATLAPACTVCDAEDPTCVTVPCPAGLRCDTTLSVCTCDSASSATFSFEGANYACEPFDPSCAPTSEGACSGLLRSYVCHTPGACQTPGGAVADNEGKACCVPGTDRPVGVPVCGQCDAAGRRDAPSAVYCSCRCGVADGDPPEPDFNFCSCPTGFACSEVRPDLGVSNGADKQLNGKYCIKDGSAFVDTASCGLIQGNHDAPCLGIGAP